jgi:RND family efflux transporter MFP subunit
MYMKHVLLAVLLFIAAYLPMSPVSAEAVDVDVVYPKATQQPQTLSIIGTVEAPNSAALAPLLPGLVAQLLVEEGQLVEKGQPLLVLDSELAELSLQQASAALLAAEANAKEALRLYDQAVDLAKDEVTTPTIVAERKSNLAIAEAEVKQAVAQEKLEQSLLARHTLKAPFSGLITERFVNLGEWVDSQSVVFQLTAQDNLRLAVSIPQEYFRRLNGTSDVQVEVTPDFLDAAAIEAKLDVLVNSAANRTRTLTGFIHLPDSPEWLVGMSARADVTIPGSEQEVTWVPKSAIKRHPDGGFSVFSVVDNKAKQIVVDVIDSESDLVAVSGLSPDLPVVAAGVAVLIDGAELNVKNSSQTAL